MTNCESSKGSIVTGSRAAADSISDVPCSLPPQAAMKGLIKRLLPAHVDHFIPELINKDQGRDVFEIESRRDTIVLRGNNGVSMASALNWYLKYYCHAHISWCGDQLNLPDRLPPVEKKVRITSPYKYRYYFIDCVFAYSTPWWDWERWEREIDWMALNGINLPLAVTGWESTWQATLRQFGFSDEESRAFCGGPAWSCWMGAHEGYGGPVSQHWVDKHLELGRKIVAREKELGMMPAVRMFYGYVPCALKDKFPHARISYANSYFGLPPVAFLDPTDPLFEKIGKTFMKEQTRLFGQTHYYAADPVTEAGAEYFKDKKYVADATKNIINMMTSVDPEGIWVMSSWRIEPAIVQAIPENHVLVIDLFCESEPKWKEHAFWGRPWVWNIIYNFGGNNGLSGNLNVIASGPIEAMTAPNKGMLSGIGIGPEAIEQNPVVYDLLAEMGWRNSAPDLDKWIADYVHRRYGKMLLHAQQAWKILKDTVYSSGLPVPEQSPHNSVICGRPNLNGVKARFWTTTEPYYDPCRLLEAWRLLLQCADELGSLDTYRYDLADLSRQVLADLAKPLYEQIIGAYHAGNRDSLRDVGERMLQLILDMDKLLATRKEFLLGRWLKAARSCGVDERERRLFEWNARNQITLWVEHAGSQVNDYANRQWSGLLKGFYLKRWKVFIKALELALAQGKEFDEPAFEKTIGAWEEQWTHQTESYPSTADGDTLAISRRMFEKYEPIWKGLSHDGSEHCLKKAGQSKLADAKTEAARP